MKKRPIQIGDVLIISLPQHTPYGHEQEGTRPTIVVGMPRKLGKPRFPMLIVAPLTTKIGTWAIKSPLLYPTLRVGTGGLTETSAVLLDHLSAVDENRIEKHIGNLNQNEVTQIQQQLLLMFNSSWI